MKILGIQGARVLEHPSVFVLRTLKGFSDNQGLLMAGAVAYYALLSIVPLLILCIVVLSHVIGQEDLLHALGRYLEWLVPSQSSALVKELSGFLENRDAIGWLLVATMIFFSSLAFAVLNKAMAVIFSHRVAGRGHHFLRSALLPYLYVLLFGLGLLVITVVSTSLQVIGREDIYLLGCNWTLGGLSGVLLYLFGLGCEIAFLTSIYWVMPAGGLPLRLALVGGIIVALLWELIRHVLVWYFSTLSQASVVYGSFTTTVVVLLTMEVAATLLLFGAQVIAEYERFGRGDKSPALDQIRI